MDDERARRTDDERKQALPEHERDDPNTLGGGVMGAGGTAVERGTETVDGPDAQGPEAGEPDEERQFPPPLFKLGDDHDTDADPDETVPPGPRATHT